MWIERRAGQGAGVLWGSYAGEGMNANGRGVGGAISWVTASIGNSCLRPYAGSQDLLNAATVDDV